MKQFSILVAAFVLMMLSDSCKPIQAGQDEWDQRLVKALWTEPPNEQQIEKLVHEGTDINTKKHGLTLLSAAACRNDIERIELLIKHGAHVNEGAPLVHAASWECNAGEAVTALLHNGSDVNQRTEILGYTPLHAAASNKKNVVIAQDLLKHGANVNAETKDGETPLYIAARFENDEAAKLMIKAGANVNEIDRQGRSLLARAMHREELQAVELLHKHGAKKLGTVLRKRYFPV